MRSCPSSHSECFGAGSLERECLPWTQDYQVVKEKAEWEPRALKHADLEEFYRCGPISPRTGTATGGYFQALRLSACRQNLYPVMEVFASRVRAPSAFGIAHMAKKYGNNARLRRSTAVIVVRSGKLQAITYPDFNPLFSLRVRACMHAVRCTRHARLHATCMHARMFRHMLCSRSSQLQLRSARHAALLADRTA